MERGRVPLADGRSAARPERRAASDIRHAPPRGDAFAAEHASSTPPPRGHSLSALRIAPPAAAAPIQRLRTRDEFRSQVLFAGGNDQNRHLAPVLAALHEFHQPQRQWSFSRRSWFQRGESNQELADRRSAALDRAEHSLYKYLAVNRGTDATKSARQLAIERHVATLLDEVQTAHVEHVDFIHRNNLDLYTHDTLDAQQKTALRGDWDKLRGSAGGSLIRARSAEVSAEDSDEKRQKALRAMHARLLSRPRGRRLLHELLTPDGGKAVDITLLPEHHEDLQGRREKEEAVAASEEVQHNLGEEWTALNQRLNRLVDLRDAAEQRGGREAWEREHGQTFKEHLARLHAVNNQLQVARERVAKLANEPVAGAEATDKGAALARPEDNPEVEAGRSDVIVPNPRGGSGARLMLSTGVKDSLNWSRDEAGNEIPSPAHILYGHELIHALHARRGVEGSNLRAARYRSTATARAPLAHWDDFEEHRAIALSDLSENALRREHDLPLRHGHGGRSRRFG